MPVVTKRPRAFSDLIEIWKTITDDSPANATRFLERVEDKLDGLAEAGSEEGISVEELLEPLTQYR